MAKLLVIFGATGNQGGSVLDYVRNDPQLSKEYRIRAVTRDPNSAASKALKAKAQDVEIVRADMADRNSLRPALQGVHTAFAITPPSMSANALEEEFTAGKDFADAALAEGAQFLIFSSLPNVSEVSGGKYTRVAGFDAKAQVEAYIRTLPVPSAFFAPGSFMQNWQGNTRPRKDPNNNDVYTIARHVSPQTQLPLIDIVADTGKFVGAILAKPNTYAGKTFCAATRLYSMEEIVQTMTRVLGKKVVYKQVPAEDFAKTLPPWGGMLVEMMSYQQDFGYYGPETKELVAWAAEHARGPLTTFEEYLRAHPVDLS